MPRTVVIVQARMTSSRLPGKVLADVAGRPLLWHVVTRALAIEGVDAAAVATSVDDTDDPVEAFCRRAGFDIFRGDLQDVLERYYRAAESFRAERVVRVTGDCPLLDPAVSSQVVRAFDPDRHDYVSNCRRRTFPIGLDTEVFGFGALEAAWREAVLPSEREHVTPYIWKHPDRFRLGEVSQDEDRSMLRWTVDETADLEFVREVFEAIGRTSFGQDELIELLDRRPDLAAINAGIVPHEGYLRSLERDRPS